jgi:hypothetical protein
VSVTWAARARAMPSNHDASMSISTHGSWREQKREHARDVAKTLRARCLERNIESIGELDEFTDDALFAQLGESLLGVSGLVPAKSFKHTTQHFRNIVKHEYDAMFAANASETKSVSEELASPRKLTPTRTSPRRRHEDATDQMPTIFERWVARLRAFEDAITFLVLLMGCFVVGTLFCDVCENHFQQLAKPTAPTDASAFATP